MAEIQHAQARVPHGFELFVAAPAEVARARIGRDPLKPGEIFVEALKQSQHALGPESEGVAVCKKDAPGPRLGAGHEIDLVEELGLLLHPVALVGVVDAECALVVGAAQGGLEDE